MVFDVVALSQHNRTLAADLLSVFGYDTNNLSDSGIQYSFTRVPRNPVARESSQGALRGLIVPQDSIEQNITFF